MKSLDKKKECPNCQYWDINCGKTCPKCGRICDGSQINRSPLDKKKPIFDIIDDIREEKKKILDINKTYLRKITLDDIRKGVDFSKTISGFRVIETKSDKNKTKELEWREIFENKTLEFEKLTRTRINAGYYSWVLSFISSLLQKQREDILKEIEKDFESIGWLSGQGECFECFTESKWNKIKERLINLLNKKDE